jgi:hypothetical protein
MLDQSAAHGCYAADALRASRMNVGSGGAQPKMHPTYMPSNSLIPPERWFEPQDLVYPCDHPDESLRGQPKGMRQVLIERGILNQDGRLAIDPMGSRLLARCQACKESGKKKEARSKIEREAMASQRTGVIFNLEKALADAGLSQLAHDPASDAATWCCMQRILERQYDFAAELPEIVKVIRTAGHEVIFSPKYHCELNPIERYWSFGKRRTFHKRALHRKVTDCLPSFADFRNVADGTIITARNEVPKALDNCDVKAIRCFFRKCFRYMQAYRLVISLPANNI